LKGVYSGVAAGTVGTKTGKVGKTGFLSGPRTETKQTWWGTGTGKDRGT